MTRKGGRSYNTNAPSQGGQQRHGGQQKTTAVEPCKYFQAGYCRFGADCHFAHLGGDSRPPPQAPKSSGGSNAKASASSAKPVDEAARAVEAVKHDLQEVTLQWPFSCYGIAADWRIAGNIIQGDWSFEELRLEAYMQGRALGNIDSYRRQVQELSAVYARRRVEVLSNPQHAIDQSRTLAQSAATPTAFAPPPPVPQSVPFPHAMHGSAIPLQMHNPTLPNPHMQAPTHVPAPAHMQLPNPSHIQMPPSVQIPPVNVLPPVPPTAYAGAPAFTASASQPVPATRQGKFEFGKIPEELQPRPS